MYPYLRGCTPDNLDILQYNPVTSLSRRIFQWYVTGAMHDFGVSYSSLLTPLPHPSPGQQISYAGKKDYWKKLKNQNKFYRKFSSSIAFDIYFL